MMFGVCDVVFCLYDDGEWYEAVVTQLLLKPSGDDSDGESDACWNSVDFTSFLQDRPDPLLENIPKSPDREAEVWF
jgi:hypothetical protein